MKHCQLEENVAVRSQAIEQLVQWIVEYHVTDYDKSLIDSAKDLLDKHGLSSFFDKSHVIPHSENTQKGTVGELMLIEYVKASRGEDFSFSAVADIPDVFFKRGGHGWSMECNYPYVKVEN